MTRCTVCSSEAVEEILDLGLQPPANRFIDSIDMDSQEKYALGVGYCPLCKTIQLSNRLPLHIVKPRFDWLTYNEPERHLDDMVHHIRQLPGIGNHSQVLGVSYQDRSTLLRLLKLGLSHGTCLSNDHFSLFNTPKFNAQWKVNQQRVDLLIARHVIEHVHDSVEIINELKELINPQGYLVFEVPDNEKILRMGNHAFIWEEHISYFMESSLSLLAEKTQAKLIWSARYSYPYEDALVGVFQFGHKTSTEVKHVPAIDVKELLLKFRSEFTRKKQEWQMLLQSYHNQGHRLAVFGAGHLAVKWINFLGLSDFIECVIDDHPRKTGMYMPGSKLPILPSSALQDRKITVCISSLSPESELRVRQKIISYFDRGGIWIPAFNHVT